VITRESGEDGRRGHHRHRHRPAVYEISGARYANPDCVHAAGDTIELFLTMGPTG